MFSWSKKSDSKKKTRKRGGSSGPVLNEFGIPIAQGGNDEELEAELRALTGGVITLEEDLALNDEGSDVEAEFMRMFGQSKCKKKGKKGGGKATGKAENVANHADIGADVDITMNEEVMGEDEDVDVDENDPELLGELMGLTEADDDEEEEEEDEGSEEEKEPEKKEVTVTSLLMERLNMYKAAEAKAKENKESSRARRFARGIKTLQQLIKKAEAGQPVLPSEIPPVIATNLKPAPPPEAVPPAPAPSLATLTSDGDEEARPTITQPVTEPEDEAPTADISSLRIDTKPRVEEEEGRAEVTRRPAPEPEAAVEEEPPAQNPWLPLLRSRRDEYKTSALTAKRNGDLETALKHVKCVKQLDGLIFTAEQGEDIDESEVPPPLNRRSAPRPPAPAPAAQPKPPTRNIERVTPLKFEAPDDVSPEEYEIPTTVMQALQQRLRIYRGFEREAQKLGDDLGVKRNSKIVQIYAEAIKLHEAGKKVPLHKLPTPPGCPPIPIPFEVE